MSAPTDSVGQWIDKLQDGDPAAAQKLWERYFHRLVGLARKKLLGIQRRTADEEDVALSAMASFCRGAEEGRFPDLHDRDNVWRLLVTITARKAYRHAEREGRQKRGGNAVLDEAALNAPGAAASAEPSLEQFLDREPTPEFVAEMDEEYRRLLQSLPNDELRSVVQWKMEGYTNEEIAMRRKCAVRSVERKLGVIRSLWSQVEST